MKEKFLIIFISGILSILLFLFVCSLTLYKTIFEREYIDNMLIKDGYYDKLYSSIQDKFLDYVPSSIDNININSIVNKKMVIRDVDVIISGIYDGDDIVIDTRELENNIDKVVNDSFSFNKITPNDEDKEKIGEFKNNIIKVYRDSIFLNVEKYLNVISLNYKKAHQILKYGIWGIYNTFSICLLVLCCLDRVIRFICKHLGIIFLLSMIYSFIVRFIFYVKFNNLVILSKEFSRLIVFAVRDILNRICIFSSVLGIVGLFLIIISVRKKSIGG